MIIKKIWRFYYEGFRDLSDEGRKLWLIILIKLFIMFAVLKLFFFPDILKKNFDTDRERIEYIESRLIPGAVQNTTDHGTN
ncbi:MAG: DUF4492 domain-containing protein [Chlorobi bacterium]|nr:DUF4492 domain-containing protein [Chlorobiota bacterium]